MQSKYSISEELEINARCRAAIDTISLFIKDAERQLKSSIDIKTLQLIIDTAYQKEN